MEVRSKTDQYRTKRIRWNQYVKTHKQVPKLHEWAIIQRNVRNTDVFFTEFHELLENCNTKKKKINCESQNKSPADQNETIKEDTNKNDEQNPFTEMLKKEMEKEANFRREMKTFEKKFGRIYTKN